MAQPDSSESPRRRLHAVVRGRVQAVGFRQFVWSRARRLGLTGWVRNGDDGRSVEVKAEGPAADLERLLEWLHQGPFGTRVDSVDTQWTEELRGYQGFDVRF